jgi:hypothetical protein
VCDARALHLVLARHTGDIGAGAPNVASFHDGGAPAHPRHMPRKQLATLTAAKGKRINPF